MLLGLLVLHRVARVKRVLYKDKFLGYLMGPVASYSCPCAWKLRCIVPFSRQLGSYRCFLGEFASLHRISFVTRLTRLISSLLGEVTSLHRVSFVTRLVSSLFFVRQVEPLLSTTGHEHFLYGR